MYAPFHIQHFRNLDNNSFLIWGVWKNTPTVVGEVCKERGWKGWTLTSCVVLLYSYVCTVPLITIISQPVALGTQAHRSYGLIYIYKCIYNGEMSVTFANGILWFVNHCNNYVCMAGCYYLRGMLTHIPKGYPFPFSDFCRIEKGKVAVNHNRQEKYLKGKL